MKNLNIIRREYERAAFVYENRPWAEFWIRCEVPVLYQTMQNFVRCGDRVLDAGCATGIHIPYILSLGANYHGIDISPSMANLARKKHNANNSHNILIASVTQLPYTSESFDIILLSKVISHYKEIREIFREILRVLKPGGYVFLCDVHKAHNKPYAIIKTNDGEEVSRIKNYLREPSEDISLLNEMGNNVMKVHLITLENANWKPAQDSQLGNLWDSPNTPILYMICAQKQNGDR